MKRLGSSYDLTIQLTQTCGAHTLVSVAMVVSALPRHAFEIILSPFCRASLVFLPEHRAIGPDDDAMPNLGRPFET